MIGYLKGEVLEHADGRVLLMAGTGSGVGYQVTVPQSAEYGAWTQGKTVEAFIYTHVREDALDLYGFSSRAEKEIFLSLLSVNGIGPKGAMGILSRVTPSQLLNAILQADKEALVQVPGIGKKTAERVVLELETSMKKKAEAGVFSAFLASGAGTSAGAKSLLGVAAEESSAIQDAKSALLGLGYREPDVTTILKKATEKTPGVTRAEDLIRAALQQLR